MKNNDRFMVIFILLLFITGLICFNLGIEHNQIEIVERSKHLEEKDCFNNRDIEHIIYNTQLDDE